MATLTWLWLCSFILPLFLFLASKLPLSRGNRKLNLPPCPVPALPILGHVYLFKQPLHRNYHQLSKKLGPIFSLRLGNRLMVVISSPTAVEECFTKNDIVLANRPRLIMGQYLSYNYTTLAMSPYGDHWRNLRRITALEIFATSRLNMFQSTREDEIKLLLRKLYQNSMQSWGRVELKTLFFELTFNVMTRMIAGKRYFGEGVKNKEANQFQELLKEALRRGGVSNPADFFPVLRWIDYRGYEKAFAKLSVKMDAFFQSLIDKHRCDKNTDFLVGHLLSLQESQPEYYTDDIIKGILTVIVNAGTDTSAVTIEWAMSCLLNNPEKLNKAKAEIDNLTGDDRLVNESDLSKLPYLQHIISETLRLFPAAPLLVAHEPSSDCKIGEFDIPRGTILLVNAWAIHRDPAIWEEPTSFNPDRFEAAGEIGPPKLMPFGMGRRACPGNGLARRVVELTIGSLIQCFDWDRIDGTIIDLTEGVGITMPKAVPLEAICKARDVLHRALSVAA